jgi:N-acetylglutamate synthase-like GNAT family acetyltransferase
LSWSKSIRRLTKKDLPRLRDFWIAEWGSDFMVVHKTIIRYDEVEGFVHHDWTGLITFVIRDSQCEVISLNSLQESQGIATSLIKEVLREAKENKCLRIFLITTNDNLQALGFYQRRGFELAALRRGAVDESRKIKPSIPRIGMNEIPLRDEIELEIKI